MPPTADNPDTAPASPADNAAADPALFVQQTLTDNIAADLTKPWYQSKTIMAAIATTLPAIAHFCGFDWTLIAPYSGDILTCIAAVGVVYARVTATHSLK